MKASRARPSVVCSAAWRQMWCSKKKRLPLCWHGLAGSILGFSGQAWYAALLLEHFVSHFDITVYLSSTLCWPPGSPRISRPVGCSSVPLVSLNFTLHLFIHSFSLPQSGKPRTCLLWGYSANHFYKVPSTCIHMLFRVKPHLIPGSSSLTSIGFVVPGSRRPLRVTN